MNTFSTSGPRGAAWRPATGFTLVELMVALLLSLLLAVAVLKMQTKMASQTVRTADSGTRDTQSRAAMDLITRDLTSAGFLLGNTQYYCDALLTYNLAGAGYFAHHAVDALAAVSGTKMTFAPTLTLNYPAGSYAGVTTDVLVTMASTATTQFNDVTNPVLRGTAVTGANPLTTGKAPISAATGLVVGDTAIMQVPISNSLACLRVPVSKLPAGYLESDGGATMPTTFYTGFVAPVAAAGFPAALTNVGIFNSRVVDIGTAPSNQVFNVYYVDGTSNPYPVLMRAQYSLVDDTVVTAPQPIAAGVVALRVSFGVDPGKTGANTAYESSATVTANKHWSFVRSVRVALVTRTVNDDPTADTAASGSAFSGPTNVPIGPASSPFPWFASITVPASKHRYTVNTTEVAYRNWLWKN